MSRTRQTRLHTMRVDLSQEDLGASDISGGPGWRPNDILQSLQLRYKIVTLLVHRGAGKYTSFESHQWSPRFDLNYFITASKAKVSFNGLG